MSGNGGSTDAAAAGRATDAAVAAPAVLKAPADAYLAGTEDPLVSAERARAVDKTDEVTARKMPATAAPEPAGHPQARTTIYVKGDPLKQRLGGCPYSARALLCLEAKGIPYEVSFVDLDHKPSWLVQRFGGKVPVLNDEHHWVAGSDWIAGYLDTAYHNDKPRLLPVDRDRQKDREQSELGQDLDRELMDFLEAKPGDDREAACRERLDSVLRELNDLLAEATRNMSDDRAPFFGGSRLNYTDCRLAPLLHHIKVAVPAIKGADRWRWNADELPALTRYLELVTRTDDWQRALASCSDEQLVADYRKHLGLPQQPG